MNCQDYEILVYIIIVAATILFFTALWCLNPDATSTEDFKNRLLTVDYWPIYGSLTCILTLLLGVWNNQSNIDEDKRNCQTLLALFRFFCFVLKLPKV